MSEPTPTGTEAHVDAIASDRCANLHPRRYREGYPCHPCDKYARQAVADGLSGPESAFAALLDGRAASVEQSFLDYDDATQIAREVVIGGTRWAVLVRAS